MSKCEVFDTDDEVVCSKYPDFVFLKDVIQPLHIRGIDPNRLNWCHEFPRDTVLCYDYPHKILKRLVTVEVQVHTYHAMLTLLPNDYTVARNPLELFFVSHGNAPPEHVIQYLKERLRG